VWRGWVAALAQSVERFSKTGFALWAEIAARLPNRPTPQP
jgi:hypothetical protein